MASATATPLATPTTRSTRSTRSLIPATTYWEQQILPSLFGQGSFSAPLTYYVALFSAATWVASTPYSTGDYVVGVSFPSANAHVYICTTAGTSGSSEPDWNQANGGTTTDNTVVWTECTLLLQANDVPGLEVSTGYGYDRVTLLNRTTSFNAVSGSTPAVVTNASALYFPVPTATWGQVIGFGLFDASADGDLLIWGFLTQAQVTSSGVAGYFAAGTLSLGLT